MAAVALLAEGVGRNRPKVTELYSLAESPSSRRAWVEIMPLALPPCLPFVALLAEGVGRNQKATEKLLSSDVALLAEGVGRNIYLRRTDKEFKVALLAEGVGRNLLILDRQPTPMGSPSSRRAWVEIVSRE